MPMRIFSDQQQQHTNSLMFNNPVDVQPGSLAATFLRVRTCYHPRPASSAHRPHRHLVLVQPCRHIVLISTLSSSSLVGTSSSSAPLALDHLQHRSRTGKCGVILASRSTTPSATANLLDGRSLTRPLFVGGWKNTQQLTRIMKMGEC